MFHKLYIFWTKNWVLFIFVLVTVPPCFFNTQKILSLFDFGPLRKLWKVHAVNEIASCSFPRILIKFTELLSSPCTLGHALPWPNRSGRPCVWTVLSSSSPQVVYFTLLTLLIAESPSEMFAGGGIPWSIFQIVIWRFGMVVWLAEDHSWRAAGEGRVPVPQAMLMTSLTFSLSCWIWGPMGKKWRLGKKSET